MVLMALDPTIVDLFSEADDDRGSIDVEERRLEAPSMLIGSTVGESTVPILAVRRSDGSVEPAPDPTRVLEEGDIVLLLRGNAEPEP
jgi:K+/H+ antiporter YhaU regulatory subunit KhtT